MILKEYANLGDIYDYLYEPLMSEYKYQKSKECDDFKVIPESQVNKVIIRYSLCVLEDIINIMESEKPVHNFINMTTEFWFNTYFQQCRNNAVLYYNISDNIRYKIRMFNEDSEYKNYIKDIQIHIASNFKSIIKLDNIKRAFYESIII